MEELQLYLDDAKDQMNKAFAHVAHELTKNQSGKSKSLYAGRNYGFVLWNQ